MNIFPSPRIVDVNGVGLAAYESGEGPPVILVHGWPEIAYSWKNQLPAVAKAGYRAIALDLKGFGASDAPSDKGLYDIRHLTDDLAGLLDTLEIEKAVFCGHDWGGAIVWPMAQLHPDRVAGVVGICTPHRPPPPVPPLQIIEKRFTDKHYFIQFQEENTPEETFTGGEEKFFRLMFRVSAPKEQWAQHIPRIFDLPGRFKNGPTPDMSEVIVSPEDLAVYVEAYRQSGFHGGVNLYRNVDRNYEIMKDIDPTIKTPALWIGGEDDMFLPPDGADGMDELVPDLEKHVIPNCGHWVTWEQPNTLNRLLIDWLSRRYRP